MNETGKPFCRIANPKRSRTYPLSADARSVVPVFARTAPRAGGERSRSSSVPLMPAIGSDAQNGLRRSTSFHTATSSVASARAVSRSESDRPDPSTIRTPRSGTPAAARSRRAIAAPAAVVPPSPTSAPITFSSISAAKLSLSRSISASTSGRDSDSTCASASAASGARPSAAAPAVTPCVRNSRLNAPAAARAGCTAT